MFKYLLLIALLPFLISSAVAEDISTRFGQATLKENASGDSLDLSLNGMKISSIEANSLNGFRDVHQLGDADVLVVYTLAGGGCGSYYFLSVRDKKTASLSPSFESCGEISFKQLGNSLVTKSMDYQGKNKKSITFKNGMLTENGKKLN